MRCGSTCSSFNREKGWCNKEVLQLDHEICFLRYIHIFKPMKAVVGANEPKSADATVKKIVEEINPARSNNTQILDM